MRPDQAPSTATILLSPAEERERWRTQWRSQGQPWRTEPEITEERQAELTERRAVVAEIAQGIFPFAGDEIGLTRADIEWLLATHEDERGPIDWADPAQRTRSGLDLRGARLSGLDLRGLPLAGLIGGLPEHEWRNASPRQIEAAALHLERADLSEAHLEGALLEGAHWSGRGCAGPSSTGRSSASREWRARISARRGWSRRCCSARGWRGRFCTTRG